MESDVVPTVPDNEILLRYTTAIDKKLKARVKYVNSGVIGETDPYVIAINASKIDFKYNDRLLPRLVRSVFPVGDYQVTVEPRTQKRVSEGFTRRDGITKANGEVIPTDLFLRDDHTYLSAVIGSVADPWNGPFRLGSDLVVVLNPSAIPPIPTGIIPLGAEYTATIHQDGFRLHRKDWPAVDPG